MGHGLRKHFRRVAGKMQWKAQINIADNKHDENPEALQETTTKTRRTYIPYIHVHAYSLYAKGTSLSYSVTVSIAV